MLLKIVGFGIAWSGANHLILYIFATTFSSLIIFYFTIQNKAVLRKKRPTIFAVAITATIVLGATVPIIFETPDLNQKVLKTFSSYQELESFVGSQNWNGDVVRIFTILPPLFATGKAAEGSNFNVNIGDSPVNISKDYSTTNVQVKGVDEADIIKTDGTYLYLLSKGRVVILLAYPAENARLLSEIKVEGTPLEIFINGDRLIVFEALWGNNYLPLTKTSPIYLRYPETTRVEIYDIDDRENPKLIKRIELSGGYFSSRMIDDYVYIITNMGLYFENENIVLPRISVNGQVKTVPATEIYYFDNIYYPYVFATIAAIDVQKAELVEEKVFLTTQANSMYVSLNNIYITYTRGQTVGAQEKEEWLVNTTIHKISISNGKVEYRAGGEVPGQVLNQFSMDEYNGYFRIATTTGDVWSGDSKNNIYVLDEDLAIAGKIEGLALGERIYSARFMGNRAYLVTFVKVDPLFVIDLSDPINPKVLGELKIPGYSDYLHPYDESHIIGLGKETTNSPEADFALYQGVKLAIFDVGDPENPKQISKYVIGERGTDSYALSDHRAFLFSRSKNLLVIPITLVEGEMWDWQGAYVFDISIQGLSLKGRISHADHTHTDSTMDPTSFVVRSFYINDVLYTVSEGQVKMNSLSDISEINHIII
ncbi:MAG: beta-propeller domain-containing protein [Candidatus Hadarchaeum sp.]|uniref:beta-propeller domain-containing protein n=1 Tax=Candidatus Hadarchaeum sp. TaxID=2883567 RepID=UPI003D10D57C